MSPATATRRTSRRAAYFRGRTAESVAVSWLRLRGYRILARDLRTPVGEVDIIARRGPLLAVVEVKLRSTLEAAADAVTIRQRRRVVRAAQWYIAGRPDLEALGMRFDVLLLAPWRPPRHLPNAWQTDDLDLP